MNSDSNLERRAKNAAKDGKTNYSQKNEENWLEKMAVFGIPTYTSK